MALVLDGSAGVSGVDGTASNPSYEGTDSNTGIFYPAADTVAIGTGGTEALRVNSSQSLLLNTTSAPAASAKMKIATSARTGAFFDLTATGGENWIIDSTNTTGSTDVLGIYANGATGLYLQDNGNVGIGTDSPSTYGNGLVVYNAATGVVRSVGGSITAYMFASNGGGLGATGTETNHPFALYTNNTERLRVDTSGNVGIGTTSTAGYKLVVSDGTTFSVVHAGGGASYYGAISNNPVLFITNNLERARFTSEGFFKAQGNSTYESSTAQYHEFVTARNDTQIATFKSNAGSGVQYGVYFITANDQNDATRWFWQCLGASTQRATIRSNGGLANFSANNVNLSDRREKTNFAPAKNYLDVICAIPVQTFNYLNEPEEDSGLTLGVVAQDVQEVAPELVMESDWGTKEEPKMRLSIYQTDLQYALMKCIQELNAKVEALEAQLKGNA